MKHVMKTMSLGLILLVSTTVSAQSIPVTNGNFNSGLSGWTSTGWTGVYNNGSDYAVATPYYGGAQNNYIQQFLGVNIDASKIYTLNATEVDPAGWGGAYRMDFVAKNGSTVAELQTFYAPTTAAGTTRPVQLQISGTDLSAYAGWELGIRLGAATDLGGYNIGGFDNVTVTQSNGYGSLGAPTSIAIPDNSFEITGITGNWANYPSGGPWLGGGWVTTNSGGYPIGIVAQNGNAAIAGPAYQLLSDKFIEGGVYTLSGYFYGRNNTSTGGIGLFANALVNGSFLDGDGVYFNRTGGQWTQASFEYVATAADAGKNIGVYVAGQYWDNIALTVQIPQVEAAAVPEPASIALWSLLGVVGLAFGYRNLRKR